MMLSAVVTAFNEEARIGPALKSLVGQLQHLRLSYEVVVVCDGCADGTESIVRSFASDYPFVRLLATPARMGKPSALAAGVDQCSGDTVLLMDGDVVLGPGSVSLLYRHLEDQRVGAVGGRVVPAVNGAGLASELSKMRCVVWHRVRTAHMVRAKFWALSGTLMVRRELLHKLPANILNDDALIGLRVVEAGYLVAYEPEAEAITYFPTSLLELLRQRGRTEAGRIQLLRFFRRRVRHLRRDLWKQSWRVVRDGRIVASRVARMALVLLELLARLSGRIQFHAGRATVLWAPARSARRPR